jgi:hypothetical protein
VGADAQAGAEPMTGVVTQIEKVPWLLARLPKLYTLTR